MKWYKCFLQEYSHKIIQIWLVRNEREGLNYSLFASHKDVSATFALLTDLHIPMECHPSQEMILQMFKYHANNETPIQVLFNCSNAWRESIMDCIWSYCDEMNIPVKEMKKVIPSIHLRLDITQRHICDVYWEHANSLLEQKDQTISELHMDRLSMLGKMAASMAHELRNPLTAIEGFMKLIRSEVNSNSFNKHKVNSFLDIIQEEFKGLYRQITSFLSFSKNDGLEEPYIICSSTEMIDSVRDLFTPRLIEENIEFELSIQCNTLLSVQRVAIQQVFSNVINNSIEALSTITGSKMIAIHTYDDEMYHYIDVIDNGIGIPPGILDNIFIPFITSKNSGTGLGIPICKQIMEKNFGDIKISSTSGGTKVTLSFNKKM